MQRSGGPEFLTSLLLGWGVNIVALLAIDWIFDSVTIDRWGPILLGAAVLGIANAIVKPILAVLTLPLIVVTLGLSYFALNVLMLALAEWIAPDFSINGFWTYIGATIVVWLVNWVLNHVLGDVFARRESPGVRTVF
jgi:putative membrane protein